MATTKTAPKPDGAAKAITIKSVKPFTGELPKRKGPNVRQPTPFDDLFGTLVAEAKKGRKVEGQKELDHSSNIMLAAVEYKEPDDLKPVVSQLRSALRFHDTNGEHGLRTWVVEDGIAFQVGPKVVRAAKPEAEAAQAS